MSNTNTNKYRDTHKMLDLYIHDCLIRRKFHATAKAFQAEANVPTNAMVVESPSGYLYEWWSAYWNNILTEANEKHSEVAASRTEEMKARELQRRQQQVQSRQQQMIQTRELQQQQKQVQSRQQQMIQTQELQQQQQQVQSQQQQMIQFQELQQQQQQVQSQQQQMIQARELQQQQVQSQQKQMVQVREIQQQQLQSQQQQMIQMQQLLRQRQEQQQQKQIRDGNLMVYGSAGAQSGSDLFMRPNPITANALGSKSYRGSSKLLVEMLDNPATEKLLGDHFFDPNYASLLDSAVPGGQYSGGPLYDTSGNILWSPQLHNWNKQFPVTIQGNAAEVNPMINPRSAGRQGSVTGVYGPGNQPNVFPIPRQGGNNSAFNGLPLTADVDQSTVDRAMDDFVQSLYANDEQGAQDRVAHSEDLSNGFSFKEVQDLITASRDKVKCCHFSSDGKLLATGHDKKAVLWCTESYTMKSTLEEHSQWITDVCFCHCMYCASRLATSSIDGTVKIWDTNNPGKSVCTFTGHSSPVISLDFHTTTENIVGSCDNVEVRYWSIDKGSCAAVFKGGSTQLRFQPCFGRLLAIAADNFVYIRDVDTGACEGVYIQGLKSKVCSICWDPSGKYLASVSSDLIKVWRLGSGSERTTVHELSCTGNKFNTCIFHPANPSLLVIGCYKTLELWNMAENKIMTIPAHEELISGLAASKVSGLVASASHDDKCVKIWK